MVFSTALAQILNRSTKAECLPSPFTMSLQATRSLVVEETRRSSLESSVPSAPDNLDGLRSCSPPAEQHTPATGLSVAPTPDRLSRESTEATSDVTSNTTCDDSRSDACPPVETGTRTSSAEAATVAAGDANQQESRETDHRPADSSLLSSPPPPVRHDVPIAMHAAASGPVDVEQRLTPMERLRSLTLASSLSLRADESADFDPASQNIYAAFMTFLDDPQRLRELIRDWDPPDFWPYLVDVDDGGDPPKSLGTYICIRGLTSDRDIVRFHSAMSQKRIRSRYYPLKLCYERRAVEDMYAARDMLSAPVHLIGSPRDERTACGRLLRTERDGSSWISTIGGIVKVAGDFYVMTSSSHGRASTSSKQRNPDRDDKPSSSDNTLVVGDFGDFDDDVEPALVFEEKSGGKEPVPVPAMQRLDDLETECPLPSNGFEGTRHWRLLPAAQILRLPNYHSATVDLGAPSPPAGYIIEHRSFLDAEAVFINAGVSGPSLGRLASRPTYLFSKSEVQKLWTIRLNEGMNLQRGDSGSWVLDYARKVVGSITAIADGYAYMASFVDQVEQMKPAMEVSGDGDVTVAQPFDLLLDLAQSLYSQDPERALGYLSQALSTEVLSSEDLLRQALEGLQQALQRTYKTSQLKAQLLRQVCEHCLAVGASRRNLKPGDITRAQDWIRRLESADGAGASVSSSSWQPPAASPAKSSPVPSWLPYSTSVPDWVPYWPQPAVSGRTADTSSSSRPQPPTAGSPNPPSAPTNPPAVEAPLPRRVESPRDGPEDSSVSRRPPSDVEPISREELEHRLREYNPRQERVTFFPTARECLGRISLVCLILNRAIGSGIFIQPSNILFLARSTGISIVLWIAGGVLVLAIALAWLELALAVPYYFLAGELVSIPRSGGDKNYLEYLYRRPRLLATCIFGVTFLLFGNLAADALQFGIIMHAALHPDCAEGQSCYSKLEVLGWAVGTVTVCCALNVFSRRLFLRLNSGLGIIKVLVVVAMALMGLIVGSYRGTCRNITWQPKEPSSNFGDIVLALVFSMYSYTSFDQPFYVLSEVRHPRKILVSSLFISMIILLVLFPIVNIAYFCIVAYDGTPLPNNMAMALFTSIYDETGARNAASVLVAACVFGSILAQTYTASRGFSPLGRHRKPAGTVVNVDDHPEQVPRAGTFLHWISTIVLILVGISANKPFHASNGYILLTFLSIFSLTILLGAFTVSGLVHLKITKGVRWALWDKVRDTSGWRSPLDPLPALFAAAALILLSVALFAQPSQLRLDDPLPYWVYPLLGWSPLLLGVLWWLGIRYWQWESRSEIEVKRWPYIVVDDAGEAVLRAEVVEHTRQPRLRRRTRAFGLEGGRGNNPEIIELTVHGRSSNKATRYYDAAVVPYRSRPPLHSKGRLPWFGTKTHPSEAALAGVRSYRCDSSSTYAGATSGAAKRAESRKAPSSPTSSIQPYPTAPGCPPPHSAVSASQSQGYIPQQPPGGAAQFHSGSNYPPGSQYAQLGPSFPPPPRPALAESPGSFQQGLRSSQSTAEAALREYVALQQQQRAGAPGLEEDLRRQAGAAARDLGSLRRHVLAFAKKAERHR
ncbi:hypothetical protein DL765_002730 [Monosporascus sp. GIB2]|nr:hypothetical protein DL765_002730 [Monosporascus sp. GIB2]